jgi:hypothetical protein
MMVIAATCSQFSAAHDQLMSGGSQAENLRNIPIVGVVPVPRWETSRLANLLVTAKPMVGQCVYISSNNSQPRYNFLDRASPVYAMSRVPETPCGPFCAAASFQSGAVGPVARL